MTGFDPIFELIRQRCKVKLVNPNVNNLLLDQLRNGNQIVCLIGFKFSIF